MSTAISTPPDAALLLPGYYLDPLTGAWLSLPWPADLADLPLSIGPHVIRWAESNLSHHLYGGPWRFTIGQRRFLHLWYSVRWDERRGRWRWAYRSGVKRGAKGTGKDPFAAAWSIIEMCGPCLPAGGLDDLHAVPHGLALVQIAANSEAQASDVLRVANAMIGADMVDEYGVDKGITRTLLPTGARIELLTFSERSSEGDPATAIVLNESHHMTYSSGGQRLAGVARRNVGKSPDGLARLIEFTNAHMPGEGSVAEESFTAWQAQVAGKTRRQDILYDSREAAPELRLHVEEELEVGIAQAYADAIWTDRERIRDEAQDPRVPLADSIRFYLNALPTNEQAWVESRAFDALARPDLGFDQNDEIALFLDCSKSTDATTLAACRLSDGLVVGLGGWQRPHGDRGTGWLAPRETVDATVRLAMETYDVQWFGIDPSPARDDDTEAIYWQSVIDGLHQDFQAALPVWASPGAGGSSVVFDMRLSSRGAHERMRQFTEQAQATVIEIEEDGSFLWDGNPMLRLHVHNARRRPNRWGVGLGKRTRDSSDLVDYAVSMVGARLGRRLAMNSTKRKTKRSGKVY